MLGTYRDVEVDRGHPLAAAMYAWGKGRAVSVFGVLSISVLMLAFAAAFVTGDARVLLARASLVTGLLGLACLISAARPAGMRPLAFYVICQFRGRDSAGAGRLEWAWQQRSGFRTGAILLTIIWGLACLLEAILRAVLAYRLPVEAMAAMSPALTVGFAIIIVGSTVAFGRLMRRGSSVALANHG
jgi:hypothetical protein